MDNIIINELLKLKEQVTTNYQPIKVSEEAMRILLDHCSEIPNELHTELHGLIAMDMGDEFILSQEECIRIINKLLR